jgi:hypothetical protein
LPGVFVSAFEHLAVRAFADLSDFLIFIHIKKRLRIKAYKLKKSKSKINKKECIKKLQFYF